MSQIPAYRSLTGRFAIAPFASWAAFGTLVAIASCRWGNSMFPVHALRFGSGFGPWLIGITLLISVLGLVAVTHGRIGQLGRDGFRIFHRRALGGTFRAASVLLGFSFAALGWWLYDDNIVTLASALLALLLSGGLWFCWGCIVVLIDDFEQGRNQR